ncbi:uncharacterized protein LOC130738035 [Lotus japonicus]|uniref:uncharacterized protein LOC130738035 n=1 Tax=Lotus japonicus TaxID=34305 RepID=UPI00258F2CD9|nr:uncharacterized protein LOC130738035 [Lotus japonicus]
MSCEQRGGVFAPARARMFTQNMNACNLLDLGSSGFGFTWTRCNQGHPLLQKRLDRGFENLAWRAHFPEWTVEVLRRYHSDHSPILLRCGKKPENLGLRPFRFEAAWVDHPLYNSIVQTAWGRREFGVVQNLQDVRDDSLEFNRRIFCNIFSRKRHIEQRITYLQQRLELVDSFVLLSQLQQAREELDSIFLKVLAQVPAEIKSNFIEFP